MVMIRPRAGDFVYSSRQFQVILRDIDLALEHGADGIVFGILDADANVDMERCREVMRRMGNRPAVFHRAFDVVADPFGSLEQLIDLGVQRVLTSGQRSTAREGAVLISELIRRSAGRIEILPAAGINPATVTEVVERTGCDQVHASLRSGSQAAEPVDPRDAFKGRGIGTDLGAVVAMRKLLG
jgi:copper homeostasis protein